MCIRQYDALYTAKGNKHSSFARRLDDANASVRCDVVCVCVFIFYMSENMRIFRLPW